MRPPLDSSHAAYQHRMVAKKRRAMLEALGLACGFTVLAWVAWTVIRTWRGL